MIKCCIKSNQFLAVYLSEKIPGCVSFYLPNLHTTISQVVENVLSLTSVVVVF